MRASLPIEIVHAIRLTTWESLFATVGYPSALVSPSVPAAHVSPLSPLSHAAIASALLAAPHPIALARALFTILTFTTEAGRTDLFAAGAALGYPTTDARWRDATSPADLVASLLAAAPSDAAVEEVLRAAQILRDRSFRPRTTQVYAGAVGVDPLVGEPTQYAAPLRSEVAAWCDRSGFGATLPVVARAVDGVLHYEIVHEGRRTTRLLASDGDSETTPLHVARALQSHHLEYEPATRSLAITTDCLEAATPLATIAGRVFFGSGRHFLDAPAVDLWKLQELGPASLVVPELAAALTMSAIGGTWHSGKEHAITPRGRDFFKALARYKIRIEGGRLDLVTLRAKLAAPDGGPERCDVALRPPHLLTVSEPEVAPLMRKYLSYAKITSPDPRPRDFYSLQPWIDALPGWSASEGEAGVAELIALELLRAVPNNRSVTPPDHPHAGRTATAYPLGGTKFLAWSPDPTIAPFVVTEEDLVAYALSFPKLAAFIAAALGLEGAATKLDDDGVLYCGRRALGPTFVLVFLLTRPIRVATAERLREAAEHGHPILVTPEGRMQRLGLREIAMPKLAGPWQPLLGAIVRALHLESFVETTLYAPADARVVLHRATMRAWVDGVLCVKFHEVHFRLLEVLLTHAAQLAHTKDIAEHIARGRQTEDTTRRAVESLVVAATKSFAAAKKEPPADLKRLVTMPKHGYYRLNAKGFVD